VAKLTDLKDEAHRRLAEKHIPADVLNRLSPEELRYRVRHCRQVMQRADTLPAETCRALHAHARKMLKSDPVAEYFIEQQRRAELASNVSAEMRAGYHEMVRHHKEAHDYPPGLANAVNQTLLGKPVIDDPELATVAEAAVRRVKQ
jgi:hypothetical protein